MEALNQIPQACFRHRCRAPLKEQICVHEGRVFCSVDCAVAWNNEQMIIYSNIVQFLLGTTTPLTPVRRYAKLDSEG